MFKDTLVYGLVLSLQRVEMRSNMCIPFVLEILDQKNHFLAHFSEITSFNNRNNECMSPGTFSTLILLETRFWDSTTSFLSVPTNIISEKTLPSSEDSRKTAPWLIPAAVILPKTYLLVHWCRRGGAWRNRRRFDCRVEIELSPRSSVNYTARRTAVLHILFEYTTSGSAA